MPTKRVPATRRARVLAWYRAHPGFHRCQDVAAALGEPTQPVAVASRNLAISGDIERHWITRPDGGKPIASLYGVSEPPDRN